MSNFLDKWNKNKFNAYESEEKTVLKLITKIGDFISELSSGVDSKTDLTGDHKGSWQGINRPTKSNEGLAGTVEQIIDITIPSINSQLEQIVQMSNNKENNIINIKYPNIKSLKGCKGDGVSDDTQTLKNIINYINTNLERCILLIPYGTYLLTETIEINSKIEVLGILSPTFKFKLTNGIGLDLVEFNNSKIENLKIIGESLINEVIGLKVNGAYNTFKNIEIKNFHTGLNIATSNTYINTFDKFLIHETSLCVNADLQGANTTNSGERMTFKNSVFCNSKELLFGNSGVLDIFFENCSFDYCNKMFRLGNGRYFFNNCHFENSLQRENAKWYTTVEYLFETFGDCKIYFNNIEFQLYGLTRIIDKNSTLGQVKFNNCMAWFRNTLGQDMYSYSEDSQWWGTSTMVRYSPFISKIGVASAIMGANYNNQQRAHTPILVLSVENASYEVKFNVDDIPQEATYIKILFN